MCRITGVLHNQQLPRIPELVAAMSGALAHGGPDAEGSYIDEHIALGHRRLSIIDVSPSGNQPMYWQQYVLVFNGEIYNYREIRMALEAIGEVFHTGSDTEILLRGWSIWGVGVLERCRGMFAFAIWDKKKQKLTLCRDRVGVKPLYYYQKGGVFMFASELKAFHQFPGFDKTIDPEAVSLYLRQGYIHAPYSIFKQVRKVMPGSLLEVDTSGNVRQEVYWSASEKLFTSSVLTDNETVLATRLEALLRESFQLRMVADVPVGVFLSGGIDSTLVAALLQAQSTRPLKTFTIGFEDRNHNEAPHAKAVAQHLGTDHTEFYCTEQDAFHLVPTLSDLYDEPFGDSSAIPTHIVARLAKQQVKVCLSADGGDELFGGYVKYGAALNFNRQLNRIPGSIKKIGQTILNGMDPSWVEKSAGFLPILSNYKNIRHKFVKFRNALAAPDMVSFFDIASCYLPLEAVPAFTSYFSERYPLAGQRNLPQRNISLLGVLDIQTYLEGDILTKVDRATMHVALEGREPFLDHHLIEFALSIPDHLKINKGVSKYLLRKVLYKHVPSALIERPKQGFAVPVHSWLKNLFADDLRQIAKDEAFFEAVQLHPMAVRDTLKRFLSNDPHVSPHFVWFIFILHQWHKRWLA